MDIPKMGAQQGIRRRKLLYGGGAALLLVGLGVAAMSVTASTPKADRATLWVDTVKRGDMLIEVGAPGTLVPQEMRWVAAETAARVDALLVKPGARVDSDTVVIELTRPDIVDQAMAAKADLKASEAEVAARKLSDEGRLLDQRAVIETAISSSKVTEMQEKAERELMASHIFPELQVKKTALQNELGKKKVQFERERLAAMKEAIAAQGRADLARLDQKRHTATLRQHQVDALHVRAGFAGILQQVLVEAGQEVAPGAALARVAKTETLMAQLRIPETQAADVRLGQRVRIDTRNGTAPGTVVRIDPKVQAGAVIVDVTFEGDLPTGSRPDQSVTGVVEIERLRNVLYVGRPSAAQPDSQMSLFRFGSDNNEAERVNVQLGRASVTQVEIRGGIAEGDKVVLSDTSRWGKSSRLRFN